ncbi:MAG: hypothetical protein NWQ28_01390 [Nodularia sp. (in: cyanobacteria)]|nr:hypothetical protein [Nodularia sp. (in: cyanobacteria)]
MYLALCPGNVYPLGANYEPIDFSLPSDFKERGWEMIIDTNQPRFVPPGKFFTGDQSVALIERSLVLLRRLG